MTRPQVEDVEEILRMTSVLAEVGYRDLSRQANQQRMAVARRLWREGLTERLLRMLWAYAQSCGRSPARLLAYWVDRPALCVEKVNEMRQRSEWTRRVIDETVREEKRQEKPGVVIRMPERRQA